MRGNKTVNGAQLPKPGDVGIASLFSSKVTDCSLFRLPNPSRAFHQGTDARKPPSPALLHAKLSCKSLMSDYGLKACISMRCGPPQHTRNVFIILCNDSLDNNSFSSEGISIKMEESIKMLYARIYKLGNFLDYCNHLQN